MAIRYLFLCFLLLLAMGCDDLMSPFQHRSHRFCCTDPVVCEQWGAPGPVPCREPGQICGGLNRCIDDPSTHRCSGSDDCMAVAGKPACVAGICTPCDPTRPANELTCPADAPRCSAEGACVAGCTMDGECARFPNAPRCGGDGRCQECRDEGLSSDCDPSAPICSGGTCQLCAANAECGAADICDEDSGRCVQDENLIVVSVTGKEGAPCTRLEPCRHVKEGVDKASGARKWVLVRAGTYDREPDVVLVKGKDVNLVARGDATLSPPRTNAPGLIVEGRAMVVVDGLRVASGGGAAGDGIICRTADAASPRLILRRVTVADNSGIGVKADLCNVTIEQSIIAGNTRGGISIASSDFTVVNTIVGGNGNSLSDFGGIKIAGTATMGGGILEFNTIANSSAQPGVATGVQCVAVGLSASNSIVYDENPPPATVQISGNCSWSSSLVGPSALAGNLNANPKFVSSTTSNYRLGVGSPAINQADEKATLSVDFEGDQRPQRGDRRDIGADEARDD